MRMRVVVPLLLLVEACGDPDLGGPTPLATPEEIAAAPTVTLVVANHSAYPLRLPGTSHDAGWFRVDGHPDWFVWKVPDDLSGSSICEDVTVAQTGAQPMDEAVVNAGDEYRFDWKTNVFGPGEVSQDVFGPSHCIHLHPAAPGSYRAQVCAELFSVHCSVKPALADFRTRCVPVTLTIPDADGELAVSFEAEDFPDNGCEADR